MSQQAGWYDDPQDEQNLRYWDGVQWTDHTSPKQRPRTGPTQTSPDQQGSAGAGRDQRKGGQWGGFHGSPQAGQGQGYGASAPGAYGQGQQGWGAHGPGGQTNPYGQQGGMSPYGQQWPGGPMGGAAGQQGAGQPTTPDGQRLAGWWHRVLARLLDGVLLAAVTLIVVVPLAAPGLSEGMAAWVEEIFTAVEQGATTAPAMPVALQDDLTRASLASLVVTLVYEIALVHLFGGTLGKLVTGLRVRLRETAGNPGLGTSALRGAVYALLPQIPLIGWLAGLVNYLWPLWDKNRQALHDKAARTNVVRKS